MVIARSDWGNDLVEFLPPDALLNPAIPVTFTQIIAAYDDRLLLIFNTDRGQWEIPGGGIEPGETLNACAEREFMEEACQVADSLTFLGYGLIQLHTRGGAFEYCAIYSTVLTHLRPFTPSEECTELALWDGQAALTGDIGLWSRAFAAHYGPFRS